MPRFTTPDFWDCECKDDYIHPKTMSSCPECLADSDNSPDSRVEEVQAKGAE